MKISRTPPDLDLVAQQWREFLSTIPAEITIDDSGEIEGMASAYVMKITFVYENDSLDFYYAGMTKRNLRARASEHKSELMRCKTTTGTGKSKVYSAQYMAGLQHILMNICVQHGGLTIPEAKDREHEISKILVQQYGADAVLTNPRKKT